MKVVDLVGRVLISEDLNVISGFNKVDLNLENVAKGMYMVTIQTEGMNVQTLRIVVE